MKSLAISLMFNLFLFSCSNGNIIEQVNECPLISNKSKSIRSFTIVHSYKNRTPISDILTLKPGEIKKLKCEGSIKSKITGSIKIKPDDYLEHKCSDSYYNPIICLKKNI